MLHEDLQSFSAPASVHQEVDVVLAGNTDELGLALKVDELERFIQESESFLQVSGIAREASLSDQRPGGSGRRNSASIRVKSRPTRSQL